MLQARAARMRRWMEQRGAADGEEKAAAEELKALEETRWAAMAAEWDVEKGVRLKLIWNLSDPITVQQVCLNNLSFVVDAQALYM